MSRGDPADLRVRRRLAQISDRLGELRACSHEMSGHQATPQSGHAGLAQAAYRASQAHAHAVEAARLTRAAYLHSTLVHDQVADLYDQLASEGRGDVIRYRQQAGRHRSLAATDRAAARRGDAA